MQLTISVDEKQENQFLRGAARVFDKDWGMSIYGQADPEISALGMQMAYDRGARYLFFGYPDEPGSYPGVVSGRASGRLRILTRRLEEGRAAFDLGDESRHRIYDREGRRYLHVLAGLEARDVPADWA